MGTTTKRADQNVLFHLLSSSSLSFTSYSLKSSFKILIHLRFSFSPISSVILPYLCSACSSSSFPFLLFLSCPAPLPPSTSLSSSLRRSCSTFRASPPLAVSSHPTFNQINSLFHSQGYDKVIMHGLCTAPAHTWTHTHTHTPSLWC